MIFKKKCSIIQPLLIHRPKKTLPRISKMSTQSTAPGESSPPLGGTLWIWPGHHSSIPLSGGLKPDSPPPSPPPSPSPPPPPPSQRSIMLAIFAKYCGKKRSKPKPRKSRLRRLADGTLNPENRPVSRSGFPSISSSLMPAAAVHML